MFKLWCLLQELRRFSYAARAFVEESERRTGEETPEDAAELRRVSRNILVLAVVYPTVCGMIVPIAVPLLAFHRGDFSGEALGMALFLGILFSLMASFFYLFAGVAVGCMLAPDGFMDSPVGAQWLELIGTKSRVGARVICFVAMIAGWLVTLGICAVEIWMLHSPALNR